MAIFNLLASDIIDLELKLEGKLPIDRDELLALVNSWGRNDDIYTKDKNNKKIEIKFCLQNEKYNLSKLDVSKITNFDSIFAYSYFDGDINFWNVSNATSMDSMFYKNKNFNSPLDKWNVSKVTNFAWMFCRTESFNQSLSSWNISNTTSLNYMFSFTQSFNQPLDKWDISNVKYMRYMFSNAEKFNQNLNSWDISNVKDMDFIFSDTKAFNQSILWDLSSIKSCYDMLYNAKSFLDKFNKGKELPTEITKIKEWLKENKDRMIAIDIENSKGKELDNFLSNFKVIDSTNLNGLHNNGIYNGNI